MAHDGRDGTPDDTGGRGQPRPPAGKRAAPWAVPAAPPAVRGGGRRRLPAAVAVVLLIAGGAGAAWLLVRDDGSGTGREAAATEPAYGAPLSSTPRSDEQDTEDAGGSSSSAPRTPSPVPSAAPMSPPVMTEDRALAELRSLRTASLARLSLDGRWVAQVASKSVGITDPLQVAANGTHTFYAVDILAESQSARAAASDPSKALVLQSLDFGKRSVYRDGQPFWVTLVDEGFRSSDEVEQWCARAFATLTPEQLANACAARTLSPPHD